VNRPALHPSHVVALSLGAGIAVANLARVGSALALLGAVALLLLSARAPRRLALLGIALALVGWWWGSARLDALDTSVLASFVDRTDHALVEITAQPRPGRFRVRARARALRFGSLPVRESVLLELPPDRVPPQGARLELLATVELPQGPENGFDERTWLRHNGVHVVLRGREGWRIVGRRGGLGGIADRLHDWLARDSAYGLTGERRAVVEGIVLGETQGLDDGLLARFQASGLYHVLAVDGLKVTAVAGGAAALFFLFGGGRLASELAALAALGGYVLAVGARPSVIRAALASGLVSLAWLSARPRDRWHALLVAAVALLAWNPYFVYDAGFQLSFAAVASIFLVAHRVARYLEGYPVPPALAEVIGVSTACGLATAPVTWVQFHQISLVTVPANVVGVPVVAEMLGLALVTALVAPVFPPLAALLGQANGWAAAFVASWARLSGGVPFAQVTSGRSAAIAADCFLLVVATWLLVRERRSV
jgi:competence protein ComEC